MGLPAWTAQCPLQWIALRVNPMKSDLSRGMHAAFREADRRDERGAAQRGGRNAEFCQVARGAGAGAHGGLRTRRETDRPGAAERSVAGVINAGLPATAVRLADGDGVRRVRTAGLCPAAAIWVLPAGAACGAADLSCAGAAGVERDVLDRHEHRDGNARG